jgi:hypothetical protein
MDTTAWIVVAIIAAVIIIAAIAWYLFQNRSRTADLRDTFGSEYDRTVDRTGDRKQAEAELASRRERVESFELHELDPEARRRFAEEWRSVQAEFVDRPSEAVEHADMLLTSVMEARGYEVDEDPDARASLISVGHGDEAENYRHAREYAARNRRGEASTEDLRQAMQEYKIVFNSLLESAPANA